jgi:hypothetical protein
MGAKFTIIIINSIPPYAFELNNILALPKGFNYRFRFQNKKKEKWMPEIANPKELTNTNGLIVLRDFQNTAKFFPIRHIHIIDVKIIGEIVYLEFNLEDRVVLNSDSNERIKQIKKFNERIIVDINVTKYPNIAKKDLHNLIFFGNDYTYDFKDSISFIDKDEEENNKWGNTIEVLGNYNNGDNIFKDVDFFNLIGIYDSDNNKAPIIKKKSKSYYRLENKKEYNVRLFQRTYTGISNQGNSSVINSRSATLISGVEDIKVILNKKDILGKYDLYEFPIIIQKQKSELLKTFLYFDVVSNNTVKLPSINIPIFVTPSIKSLLTSSIVILSFIICFIAYWYSNSIVSAIFTQAQDYQKLTENLKNILLPILILLGGNSYTKLNSIKEFLFGRIYLQ